MRPFIKAILVFSVLSLVTSCTNDFLTENISHKNYTLGNSTIYVSPDWDPQSGAILLPSVNDVDFDVVSTPSWLSLSSKTGHLTDSSAVVTCSASENPDYDKVGIYMEFMTVKAAGKLFKVPVGYITEGKPVMEVEGNQSLLSNLSVRPTLSIKNNGNGILLWKLTRLPDWLELDTSRLEFKDFFIEPYTTFKIPLRFKLDQLQTTIMTGTVGLSTNDKVHPDGTVQVTANFGTPRLELQTATIDFSFSESEKSMAFQNNGDGTLVWRFEDIPDWLNITPSSGVHGPYDYGEIISIRCDRTKLGPGQNSATIRLVSNDGLNPSKSITVKATAPGGTGNIRQVAGTIVDAVFNKQTNVLYYVTSSPNKFVAYDVVGKSVLHELALTYAPTCLAVSEDWTKAAIGHNGFVSSIDLSNNTLAATYAIDYSVNDITWAKDDWFAFTQKGGTSYYVNLHWINIANGVSSVGAANDLDNASIVKKVPNQPYLIATRKYTSPSGFFAFELTTWNKKSYAHMDLEDFWFTENGEYTISRNRQVYRTSSSTGSTDTRNATINAINTINTGYVNGSGIRNCYSDSHNLWILLDDNACTSVYKVEDTNFTVVKQVDFDNYYQLNQQPSASDYRADYVFVNQAGTELVLLCKGVSNGNWLMQFVATE